MLVHGRNFDMQEWQMWVDGRVLDAGGSVQNMNGF